MDGETHVALVSGDGRLASLARLVGLETFSGILEIADVRGDDVLTAETVSGRIDRAVHRQRLHGDRYARFNPVATGCLEALGSIDIR